MKNYRTLVWLIGLIYLTLPTSAHAQQRPNPVVSPEILADNSVIFRAGIQTMTFGKFETSLIKDVIPDVEANYRVQTDPAHRESEGGHTWVNWRLYLTELTSMLFK